MFFGLLPIKTSHCYHWNCWWVSEINKNRFICHTLLAISFLFVTCCGAKRALSLHSTNEKQPKMDINNNLQILQKTSDQQKGPEINVHLLAQRALFFVAYFWSSKCSVIKHKWIEGLDIQCKLKKLNAEIFQFDLQISIIEE
jgi:hypothetical protein